MSPGQSNDLDKGSDRVADPSRAERQAKQENALQRWETEGGAEEGTEEGTEEGAKDRTDGNEVAEIGGTDTGEQDG
jgi:hypothetical protein